MAENVEERVFEYFLQVPEKVRMKMIDKMETDDRCRMTRCSKACTREARSSKNWFIDLEFRYIFDYAFIISARHSRNRRLHGYNLFIHENSGFIQAKYFNLRDRQIWGTQLKSSTNLVQSAIDEFKTRFRMYKNTIKKLSFMFPGDTKDAEMWKNIDFEIESLENLEELRIYAPVDIQKLFSKIRHPLKQLSVGYERNIPISESFEQIYQVQQLYWNGLRLNNQQLSLLSATHVEINIGELTAMDIFKFIRSWQNRTLGRDIKSYRWELKGSNFDRQKLLRLLRVRSPETVYIEIKHFNEPGKSARLCQTRFDLIFRT